MFVVDVIAGVNFFKILSYFTAFDHGFYSAADNIMFYLYALFGGEVVYAVKPGFDAVVKTNVFAAVF